MFLNLTHQAGLAQEAQSLCRQFTDYKEERLAAPAMNHHRGPPDPENRGPLNRLTWASLNIRSIYGREKTLVELMRSNQISALALQETFERANDPPVGLPKALYKGPVWLLSGVQGGGVAETVGVDAADVFVAADVMAEVVDVVVALDVGPP
jgi:hypothetical protein